MLKYILVLIVIGGTLLFVSAPASAATNVTACGVLSTAGETYVLQNDVSSTGTCFAIAADNITLNLNGRTVTYGTAAGDNVFGVAMPPGYATDITRANFPGLPDSAFGGGNNAIIHNGSITQGAGDGVNSHAIYGRLGTEIYNTITTVHGDDTDNIYFVWARDVLIHDNTAYNNSTVVSNRHQGKGVIESLRDSGNTKIYNNTIIGGPQWGIRLSHNSGGETGFEIYGNTISQNARVANPYSIGAHADNLKVYDNVLTPTNGRGIHVLRDNIEVFNNTVTVQEGPNAEYAGGWSHGIKLEGTTNSSIHDNTVTANAGGSYGGAFALDMTVGVGSNNEVYNNTFTAITSESGEIAAAVNLVGIPAGNELDIHHNIFRSNNYLVQASWDAGSDVLFRSNTFEQTGALTNFHFMHFDTGSDPSEYIRFLDSTLGSGVSQTDITYRTAGATLSWQIEEYLSLTIQNQGGTPIAGALITIRDANGTVVASGNSSGSGTALFDLVTHQYAGKPPAETDHTPFTITVSADGYVSGSHVSALSASRAVTFALAASGAGSPSSTQESSYDAPGVPGARTTPQTRATNRSFFGYDSRIRGGFHIAAGNVLGDSKAEIITGTASGLAPQVRVFDNQGNVKAQFFAYDSSLRNGVTVTACDIDGDGTDEIVTGQGRGGWPLVKIFDGYGTVINNGFFVLDGKFTGGVNVACGDTNGDGISEIVVAAMRGGGPQVMVYNEDGKILTNFMAYDPGFRGGINVSTADADGDGKDEIITGPQWGAPHVQIFQIRPNELKRLSPGFFAFNRDYRGGVSVAGVDTDGDGTKEIVVGVGDNATPFVKVFDIRERWRNEFYAYATNFLGGVQLAGGDVDGDGSDELITIPRSGGAPHVRVLDIN